MKKVVTIQTEVDLENKWYGNLSNHELVDVYNDSGLTLLDYLINHKCTVIAVNDAKEKADADETGITWGTSELDEGPFG